MSKAQETEVQCHLAASRKVLQLEVLRAEKRRTSCMGLELARLVLTGLRA